MVFLNFFYMLTHNIYTLVELFSWFTIQNTKHTLIYLYVIVGILNTVCLNNIFVLRLSIYFTFIPKPESKFKFLTFIAALFVKFFLEVVKPFRATLQQSSPKGLKKG